jgi:proton-translocating NADH-quinone oxidoreductase chain L
VFLILCILVLSFLYQSLGGRYIGNKGSSIIAISGMLCTLIVAMVLFTEVVLLGSQYSLKGYDWVYLGSVRIVWGLNGDNISSLMSIVVIGISLLVHIYSLEYMGGDPHKIRFIAYLTLFTFFMMVLVSADNFLQMFLGWEGVGLASYLLINYWYTRIEANRSALKALFVNRVGDYGLGMGILIIYYVYGTFDFNIVFSLVNEVDTIIMFGNFTMSSATLLGGLLFIGAIGKSAQLGLHIWLPDAMEGPTPVSALIHAATMVTAGVFVLIKCCSLIEKSDELKILIVVVGGLTALFAGTTGMYQNDIKKIIAFSTCSQLGFMVAACGFSAYSIAFFHLVNHAFFKALLFLSAGSIIHAIGDEQDIRRMGGLVKILPFSYVSMLVGSLALAGFPYLAGFYSKELIFAYGSFGYTLYQEYVYYLLLIAGLCTSYYSIRLLKLTFFNEIQLSHKNICDVKEGGICILLPLSILSLGSILVGFLLKDLLNSFTFSSNLYVNGVLTLEIEMLESVNKMWPLVMGLLGMFIGMYAYEEGSYFRYELNRGILNNIYTYFVKKWCLDIIYNEFFNKNIMLWSYEVGFKVIDRGLLAFWGPGGITRVVRNEGVIASYAHTGYIYHYVLSVIFSIILLLSLERYLYVEGIFIIYFFIAYYCIKVLERVNYIE